MDVGQPALAVRQRLAHMKRFLQQHSEVGCVGFPSNADATVSHEGRAAWPPPRSVRILTFVLTFRTYLSLASAEDFREIRLRCFVDCDQIYAC